MLTTLDRFRGCLLGLAVGDAVGTTVEFQPRGSFAPLTDMAGGGPFRLPAGAWTDDTSMALCLATSLLERDGFDARDQMDRYCRWYRHGYLSSTGECFDIGLTVSAALRRYEATGEPFSGPVDANTAGNGCLMRLAPVPLFYYPNRGLIRRYAAESARTTHGAAECLDTCRLLGDLLFLALEGVDKRDLLMGSEPGLVDAPAIKDIAAASYLAKPLSAIAGTGYVVRSLEAALWCFATTDTFQDAVLAAANLGDDADTTAAICGQVAGAYYGVGDIPAGWLDRLVLRGEILRLAERLYHAQPAG